MILFLSLKLYCLFNDYYYKLTIIKLKIDIYIKLCYSTLLEIVILTILFYLWKYYYFSYSCIFILYSEYSIYW